MITFAHPLSLFALISIPLIIILFNLRPKRRSVTVSNNAFWQEALREQERGLGLQKLLRNVSLLLLLAVALLLGLGAANPLRLVQAVAQDDTVVVLDSSASMKAVDGGVSRFSQAKDAARELIGTLADSSRMLLITSAGSPSLHGSFAADKTRLRATLSSLTPTDESGSPREAIALALSLLKDRDRARVYFLTDGAFDADLTFPGARVHYTPVGTPANNVAITRFDIRAEFHRESRYQVLTRVRNFTDTPVVVPLTVALENRTLFTQTLALAGNETKTLIETLEGTPRGRVHASIDIDDALEADNEAYAVARTRAQLHILLLSTGNHFLESAFLALPNVNLVTRSTVDRDALEYDAQRFDIVVVDRLELETLPPGRFLLVDTTLQALGMQDSGFLANQSVEHASSSPLVQGVELTGVKVSRIRKVDDENILLDIQPLFGNPQTTFAFSHLSKDHRIVYLGFDVGSSDLAYRAAFPVLLRRIGDWLKPRKAHNPLTHLAPGDSLTLVATPGSEDSIVRTPDGNGLILRPSNENVVFDQTSRVGFYRFTTGGEHRHFAVSLNDAQESNLERRASLTSAAFTDDALAAPAYGSVSLWPYLTALALLFLMLEWMLGRPWGRNA